MSNDGSIEVDSIKIIMLSLENETVLTMTEESLVCLIQLMLVPEYVDSAKLLVLCSLPTSQFCNHEERLASIIRFHACLSEMCPTVPCARVYLNSSQRRIRQQHIVIPIGP